MIVHRCSLLCKKWALAGLSLFLVILMASCGHHVRIRNYLNESKEDYEQRMAWWKDARFGMFIHWGVYAVPAGIYHGKEVPGIGEWIMNSANIPVDEYENFARQFNPVDFDAEKWVRIAKQAGMKYIVITSKHHDGFCLWDTKYTDYNIVDFTPYGKDVLKQLAAACKKEGIHLGFYHSIMDWHNPDAHGDRFPVYREEYLKPQLKELLTYYGDIDILWFDGEWIDEWTEEQGKDLYNYVRSLNPDIIINNRVGKGRMGMQGMNKGEGYVGDFGTPEQGILNQKSDFSWETCMTMNDTWGFKKNDHHWKSTKVLIDNLIDIASKGGNYLLNVGPDARGVIPEESVKRLQEMGKWLDINKEAIYGTRAFAYPGENEKVRYTRSKDGNTVYAMLLSWPGSVLKLAAVQPAENASVFLLGTDTPLKWTLDDNGDMIIHFPEKYAEEANRPCRYAWTLKIEGKAWPLQSPPTVVTGTGEEGGKLFFCEPITLHMSPAAPAEDLEIRYTLDGTDPGKSSPLYTEPVTLDHTAVVKARLFSREGKASFIRRIACVHAPTEKLPVAEYRYVEGSWDSLPDFQNLQPLRSGYLPSISLANVHPRDNEFGVVFSGNLNIEVPGDYTFSLTSDDGSRLEINNRLIIDHDGVHGFVEKTGTVTLKPGIYPFRIEYFEATGGDGIKAMVSIPGEKEFVALHNLFTNKKPYYDSF